jgi:hypothetical protein
VRLRIAMVRAARHDSHHSFSIQQDMTIEHLRVEAEMLSQSDAQDEGLALVNKNV